MYFNMKHDLITSFLFSTLCHFVLILFLCTIPFFRVRGDVPGIIFLKLYPSFLHQEKGGIGGNASSKESQSVKAGKGLVRKPSVEKKEPQKIQKKKIAEKKKVIRKKKVIKEKKIIKKPSRPSLPAKETTRGLQLSIKEKSPIGGISVLKEESIREESVREEPVREEPEGKKKTAEVSITEKKVRAESEEGVKGLSKQNSEEKPAGVSEATGGGIDINKEGSLGGVVSGGIKGGSGTLEKSEISKGTKQGETTIKGDVFPTIPLQKEASEKKPEISSEKKADKATSEKKQLEKPSGIILVTPEVHGDIKVEVKLRGNRKKGVRINFIFRKFPLNRRSVPLQRWETQNDRPVNPEVVNYSEDVSVYVIKKIDEGIYYIYAETNDNNPVEAEFNLKIFDKTSKANQKKMGVIKITGRTLLTRLLMPEGIFWDDSQYFSGIIEDSESITKFNTEHGIIWKEYKD